MVSRGCGVNVTLKPRGISQRWRPIELWPFVLLPLAVRYDGVGNSAKPSLANSTPLTRQRQQQYLHLRFLPTPT